MQRTCLWQEKVKFPDFWQLTNKGILGHAHFFDHESSALYLTGSSDWDNYSIEAGVKSKKGVDKTIVARHNPNGYYTLNLRGGFGSSGNDLVLSKKCCQNHYKNLARFPLNNNPDTWYKLRLVLNENNIKAYVDDKLYFNITEIYPFPEEIHLTGQPGLMVWGGNYNSQNDITEVEFTNVLIKKITPPQIYVLIPGMGASWNPQILLTCGLADIGKWTIAPYTSIYDRLNTTLLTNAGFKLNEDYYIYAYDWRLSMEKQADPLKKYLDNIMADKQPGTKINIIAHSMGGLVIRSFLDSYPNRYNFNRILTLGSPHQGTTQAYSMWEAGIVDNSDRFIKLASDLLINECKTLHNFSRKETLQALIPSILDLIPIYPFLQNANKELIPVSDMTVKNNWLLNLGDNNSSILTIGGKDKNTLEYIQVTPPSAKEKEEGLWIDGKPVSDQYSKSGDNTILLESALLPGTNKTLPQTDHGQLMYSDLGIKTILDNLDLENIILAQQKKENGLTITSKPTNLEILNGKFEWKRYKLKL